MSRSEERMGLKSGWFLTVIPYSVSMPMTFGMAMRFLAPWRTETPGPGQGKDEGGAPPPSRSRLQILSGIDDALDAPLLLLGLAHQRLHVDDPLTLLPRDLRPVVGVRGVRQVLRSEEHTSELQSRSDLVCRLLLEKKKKTTHWSFAKLVHDRSCHMHPRLFMYHDP